ncbi:MAG: hypothetical protein CMH57_15125 [Myxococcales bacterium]|nr:hypothetical protein [Myxococcales bacterium]
MHRLATILVGIVLLLLESLLLDLFGLSLWLPHVASALVVYIALEREMFEGCVEVLGLAWVAELLSGSPPGVYALAVTLLFFGVRLSAVRLSYRAWPVRLGLSVVAALGLHALLLIILLMSGHPTSYVTTFALAGAPSSLAAPLGLVVVWLSLERLDELFKRRKNIFSD